MLATQMTVCLPADYAGSQLPNAPAWLSGCVLRSSESLPASLCHSSTGRAVCPTSTAGILALGRNSAILVQNVAVVLEARSVASVFKGENRRNRIPGSYKRVKTTAPSFRVFNQVTLSVTGLNVSDTSHNILVTSSWSL